MAKNLSDEVEKSPILQGIMKKPYAYPNLGLDEKIRKHFPENS